MRESVCGSSGNRASEMWEPLHELKIELCNWMTIWRVVCRIRSDDAENLSMFDAIRNIQLERRATWMGDIFSLIWNLYNPDVSWSSLSLAISIKMARISHCMHRELWKRSSEVCRYLLPMHLVLCSNFCWSNSLKISPSYACWLFLTMWTQS